MGTLRDIDEVLSLQGGTPLKTLSGKESVDLTRRLAIIRALESYTETKREDKFKAFALGMKFEKADGEISIDDKECAMIQAALESQWPQPGIFVPMCDWLEGGEQSQEE